jgi:hypothetical protein
LCFCKHDHRSQNQRKWHDHNEDCKDSDVDPGISKKYQDRLLSLSGRGLLVDVLEIRDFWFGRLDNRLFQFGIDIWIMVLILGITVWYLTRVCCGERQLGILAFYVAD